MTLSKLKIIVIGEEWSGKSSVGNTILGKKIFDVTAGTQQHKQGTVVVHGSSVMVVDTPGWDLFSSEATPFRILAQACQSLGPSSPDADPHALLLTLPVCMDPEWNKRAAQRLERLFTPRVWRQTILLFTRPGLLQGRSIEYHLQQSGKAFQGLLERCGNRYLALNNLVEDTAEVKVLLEKIENMVAENGGECLSMRDLVWEMRDRYDVKMEQLALSQNHPNVLLEQIRREHEELKLQLERLAGLTQTGDPRYMEMPEEKHTFNEYEWEELAEQPEDQEGYITWAPQLLEGAEDNLPQQPAHNLMCSKLNAESGSSVEVQRERSLPGPAEPPGGVVEDVVPAKDAPPVSIRSCDWSFELKKGNDKDDENGGAEELRSPKHQPDDHIHRECRSLRDGEEGEETEKQRGRRRAKSYKKHEHSTSPERRQKPFTLGKIKKEDTRVWRDIEQPKKERKPWRSHGEPRRAQSLGRIVNFKYVRTLIASSLSVATSEVPAENMRMMVFVRVVFTLLFNLVKHPLGSTLGHWEIKGVLIWWQVTVVYTYKGSSENIQRKRSLPVAAGPPGGVVEDDVPAKDAPPVSIRSCDWLPELKQGNETVEDNGRAEEQRRPPKLQRRNSIHRDYNFKESDKEKEPEHSIGPERGQKPLKFGKIRKEDSTDRRDIKLLKTEERTCQSPHVHSAWAEWSTLNVRH